MRWRRTSSLISTSRTRLLDVEADHVAIAHGRNRAAQRGFGRDVAGHQSVRRAAEAAVGQQRNRCSQSFAHNCAGDAQHFAHARTALGTFVADDDHIAGLNFLGGHRGHGVFFAIRKRARDRDAPAVRAR